MSPSLFSRYTDPQGYWLPLTVGLHFDSTVTDATLDYTDGCLKRQALLLAEDLKAAFRKEIGLVFAHVKEATPGQRIPGTDGDVTVSLGFKELELFIPRRATKSYRANLSLGATVAVFNLAGEMVYSKSLRYDAHGEVETDKDQCEVAGLAGLAREAAGRLAEGFKKGLGTSVKVREMAQAQQQGGPVASASPGPPSSSAPPPAQAPPLAPAAPPASASPLTFHAMLGDENRNQVLESGERVILEIEVGNAGREPIKSVSIVLTGTPALVNELGTPLVVGDLQPGQSKVLQVKGRLPEVTEEQEAALIVSLETPDSNLARPVPKKFVAALRPGRRSAPGRPPVDVDRIPARAARERPQAVGLAIGIGTFRDPQVPALQFAARDAKTMAKYFSRVVGIPAQRVKLLTDEQALKQDLAEALEEWLPQQTGAGGEVFVFFSGRAVVDPATGAVLLMPYEGHPANTNRLYSLRRLRAALARLPARHMVLMLEVTLTALPGSPGLNGVKPDWYPVATTASQGELVQLVGISGTQEAAEYVEARHGLFTYYLLSGLSGAADRNKDEVISVAELFDYARAEVTRAAKDLFGLVQEPQAIPVPNSRLKVWAFPMVRLR
ncbi:hypothetical protein [Nitrospira sp. Kam-Ns4a]